jgi:pentatricopeptide repeat protein
LFVYSTTLISVDMRSASVRVFARRIRIWNVRQQRRLPAVTAGTIVEWDPPQHPYPRCYSLDSSPVQPQQRQQQQQGGGVGSSTSAAATTTTTKILELLDERRHPHGSFSPEQFTDANDLLVAALNLRNSDNNATTANACLHLIERMVTEKTLANHPALKSLTFFGHPDTLNAYVKNWFDTAIAAAAQRKTVVEPPGFQWMSAHQLYQKLQSMSARLPEFRYDTTTLGMILNVAIHEQQQQDPTKAPAVAEQLLDDMMKHKQQLQSFTLKLDAVLFTQVIKAWADSRLPEAPDRMELLLQRMWTEGVAPDLVSYTILVRVYANMGAVKKMEAVLESMKQQGLEPDSVCLISLLYCYAKAGQFQWAENVLEYMMSIGKDNHNYRHLIGEGVQHILTAYRQKIAAEKGSRNKQMQALNGAVTFYQAMGQCDDILDARSLGEFGIVERLQTRVLFLSALSTPVG